MAVRLACRPTPTCSIAGASASLSFPGWSTWCLSCRHGWLWGGGDERDSDSAVRMLGHTHRAGLHVDERRLEPMPKVPNPARPLFSPVVSRGLPGLQSARVCPSRGMSYCRVKVVFCTTQEIFAKTPRLTRRSFFPCSPNFSQVPDLCGPDARRRCSCSPDWWLASSDPSLASFIFQNHHPV
jgi:hypothetical protein